jgi:SAM-dependent methyltransferase
VGSSQSSHRSRPPRRGVPHGPLVEIGAGTGANVAHYRPRVDLSVCEPAQPIARRLERAVSGPPGTEISSAPAEDLPAADASVDALVSALMLCTVVDPRAALAEARRVLRADGMLVVLEHVRGRPGLRAGVQDLVAPAWRRLACGCRPNQDTESFLQEAGFVWVLRFHHNLPVPLVSPLVAGGLAPARDVGPARPADGPPGMRPATFDTATAARPGGAD